VDLTRLFHAICAAELDPETVGGARQEAVLNVLAAELAWANTPVIPLPPFVTCHGPSSLLFYAPDGCIVDMTKDFQEIAGEPREVMLARLTEHIRKTRGGLLHQAYNTTSTGGFDKQTQTTPLHDSMVTVLSRYPGLLSSGEDVTFSALVVQEILRRKKGNVYDPYLDDDIRALTPSLRQVGARPSDAEQKLPVPLLAKIKAELGARTLAAFRMGLAANYVQPAQQEPAQQGPAQQGPAQQEPAQAQPEPAPRVDDEFFDCEEEGGEGL